MAEQKPKVAKQHFVPQFYLRRFINVEGQLERLELEGAKLLSQPKSPSAECVEQYFYAVETGKEDEISQEIEDFWKSIEDFVAERLDDVEQKIVKNQQLDDEDIFVFANLGAMLWMRTPMFRETLNHNMATFEKQLYQRQASSPDYVEHIMRFSEETGAGLTREKAEEIRQFIVDGKYKMSFNNVMHLRMIASAFEGFRNMFANAKWRFYIANGSRRFVTSTSPCIEVFPERKGFYGPSFYEREKFFPLSPHVLAEIKMPLLPGKRVKRKTIDDTTVLEYNRQQANWSSLPGSRHSRCYANRTKELEELAKIHEENRNPELLKLLARSVVRNRSEI